MKLSSDYIEMGRRQAAPNPKSAERDVFEKADWTEPTPQVSFDILTQKKGERPKRGTVRGDEKEIRDKLKRMELAGYRVKILNEPVPEEDPWSSDLHYQITAIDPKTGKPVKLIAHGDEDKLRAKFEELGYTDIEMQIYRPPAQARNYNVFDDGEVRALLKKKGVPPQVIDTLAKDNLRGESFEASRMIRDTFRLTPYYTRFSSN